MAVAVTRERLLARAAVRDVSLPSELADRLRAYLDLLALWNRRINLTAFDLSAPSDEAIDRLVIEPLVAARLVRTGDRRALDIGSGGGSPSVPFMMAVPQIEMMLVEVRARKAAFLREVIRTLSLPATVEVARVEDLAASGRAGLFDVVLLRAVRADQGVWRAVERLLISGGRVLWFGGVGQTPEHPEFAPVSEVETIVALERVRLS
jgi:16S rRNA (guanine527-N7)-methyltransferase